MNEGYCILEKAGVVRWNEVESGTCVSGLFSAAFRLLGLTRNLQGKTDDVIVTCSARE